MTRSTLRIVPLLCAALAAVLLLATRRAAASDLDDVTRDTWNEIRTDHFDVLTDANPGIAVGVGRRLEQFTWMLHALYPALRVVPAQPLHIFVFRDQATMDRFRSLKLESVAGLASTGPACNVFLMNAQVEGSDRADVVCHEYTHVFLHANHAEIPAWLNEGLAEYYGTFRLRGRRAEFGATHDWMVRWLNSHDYADLSLLFAVNTQANAYRRDNDLRNTTYAEGWALTHYLMAAPDRAAKLDSVLAALRRGTPDRIAFRSAFPSEEWPQLVTALQRYVKDGMLDTRTVAYPEAETEPVIRTRPVDGAEACARLGELMFSAGPDGLPRADSLFTLALSLDSTLARARAAQGLAAVMVDDTAKAERCYARATAQAPADARVALLVALGALDRVRNVAQASPDHRDAILPYVALARERFQRCLQLAPDEPEANGDLGLLELWRGHPADAIPLLERGAAALPSHREFASALARAREAASEAPAH